MANAMPDMLKSVSLQKWAASIGIVMVIVLSWTKFLDGLSFDYIEDALVQASASYGVAKLLNGAISVIQTTKIDFQVLP